MAIREQGMEMSETGDQAPAKPARRRPRKKAQMPARAYGRSLSDFEPLLPAERKLLEATARGVVAKINDERPEEANAENTVRAEFLRFLLLDGDETAAVHGHGVRLNGAWIDSPLDLENIHTHAVLDCRSCNFSHRLNLCEAHLYGGLFLPGCRVPGIDGDGLVTDDGIFLRDGFESHGSVRLLGARIGGNLECTRGRFGGDGGRSLIADGMHVSGALIFRKIDPPAQRVSLASSRVGRLIDDATSWGKGLILDGFTYDTITGGSPKDAATRIAWLDQQPDRMRGNWEDEGPKFRMCRTWLRNEVLRIWEIATAWLSGRKAPPHPVYRKGADFCPQPWRQLRDTLQKVGLPEDARQVAIAFEIRLRDAELIGTSPEYWSILRRWAYRRIARILHWIFWCLTGFGHRPLRLVALLAASWLLCGAFYWAMSLPPRSVFAPTNPVVFQSNSYAACRPSAFFQESRAPDYQFAKSESTSPIALEFSGGFPAFDGISAERHPGNWYLCKSLREEYTGLSPLAYSLDVLLPLVDLQQQRDWAPMINAPADDWTEELRRVDSERLTRLVIWFQTLFGWVASLLLVAIVSGLTKRRED